MQTQTNNNPTPWELKALTVQLAQDVAQVKEMMTALAKTQTDMMQALKRPRAPEEAEDTAPPSPAQKKTKIAKPPRNANPWHVGVRLMQHFASQLAPRHRRGLMRYAKVHKLMHDKTFRAFLDKHLDRTRPMDAGAVDRDMVPAMAKECKALVKTLKGITPAAVDALLATPQDRDPDQDQDQDQEA